MRIAVIDIGTNSIHMMMADIQSNYTFELIGREKEMTRLGDGTLSSGYLSEEVMERGLAAIKKFYHLAQSKGIQKIFAVATSAVREAENGGDFVQKMFKETSIKVRVITGEEEGRLIYLGVKHSLNLKEGNTLIVDIGGGSVEVMVVTSEKILFLKSLKLGVARLKDLFLKKNSPKEIKRLEAYIEKHLKSVCLEIRKIGFQHAIGTSGTLNTLAAMAFWLRNKNMQIQAVNPLLKWEDMKSLNKLILETSSEDLAKLKGLDPKRVDLISSGAVVASVMMKQLDVREFEICDKAIRDGMIYDYIAQNQRKIKSEAEIPDLRRRNVMKLALKCNFDRQHGEHVAELALQIFDQTRDLHHLGSVERELLEYASLLHDIGYHIGYDKHHRHAYYLIRNVSMNGFSQEEIEILANVARYHRRSSPKKSHREFATLSRSARNKVKWLAAIVRIADAMDRSHFAVIDELKLRKARKKIVIIIKAHSDPEYEIWDAKRKCDLFSEITHREILFKFKAKRKLKTLKKMSA